MADTNPLLCEHCSECDGMHHWLDMATDDDGNPVDPHFACKHCDATAAMCDECLEPIFPVTGQTLCDVCTGERGDDDG